ncbi:MAG: 6-carboxytetrahydropterin synthase, partial [Psychroserpens sp.]|nr:6-carboxytetrahydropterin synthase [Psychroserpens sp.]
DVFDHSMVFNKNTPHIELAQELIERNHHVLLVDYQPTTEMMISDFAEKIKNRLPQNIKLHSLKLRETGTSFAQWFASDNE